MTTDLRDRILQTSTRLFRSKGYAAVGVTDVCKAVGVSRAHFYRLFDSKCSLAVESIAVFAAERDAMVARALCSDLPIRGQVQRMFATLHAEQLAALERTGIVPGSPFALFADDDPDDASRLRAAVDAALGQWRRRLGAALALANGRGEVSLTDTAYAAEAIVALAEGALALARVSNNPRLIVELAPAAMSLMLDRKATGSWPLILWSTAGYGAVATGAHAAVRSTVAPDADAAG